MFNEKISSFVGLSLAGVGITWGAITADAILPLFSLAAGAAVGVIVLVRDAKRADTKSQLNIMRDHILVLQECIKEERRIHSEAADMMGRRFAGLQANLDKEIELHDRTRRRLETVVGSGEGTPGIDPKE